MPLFSIMYVLKLYEIMQQRVERKGVYQKSIVLVASRDVKDEELFLNYRIN